jgi:16S rRNA processing protein RimM
MVPAGRVGRPHGLDGSFHVTRPVPALLDEGAVLEVQGRPLRVVRRAGSAE